METNGTTFINLGGKEWELRPGFRALSRVETALDTRTQKILERMQTGDLSLVQIATIGQALIAAGLKGGAVVPSVDDVGEWMMEDGKYVANLKVIVECYASALRKASDTTGKAAAGNGVEPGLSPT